MREITGSVPVTGKYRGAISVFMFIDQVQGLFITPRPDHRQYRTKYLIGIYFHRWRDFVENRGTDKTAVLVSSN